MHIHTHTYRTHLKVGWSETKKITWEDYENNDCYCRWKRYIFTCYFQRCYGVIMFESKESALQMQDHGKEQRRP